MPFIRFIFHRRILGCSRAKCEQVEEHERENTDERTRRTSRRPRRRRRPKGGEPGRAGWRRGPITMWHILAIRSSLSFPPVPNESSRCSSRSLLAS